MAFAVKSRGFTKKLERRTVGTLSRHNRTFFLFIIAFSSVILYMTTRMLRHSHSHMDLYMKAIKNKADLGNSKKNSILLKKIKQKDKKTLTQEFAVPEQRIEPILDFRSLPSFSREPGSKLEINKDLKKQNQQHEESNVSSSCQKSSIFLLVLIFSEEPKTSLRNFIRKTWCQRQTYSNKRRMTCLFMIGQHSMQQGFLEETKQESINNNDVLLMSLRDDIRNSSLKLITGMKWVTSNCPNVKYVLRTEDDVIINMNKLMESVLPQIPLSQFAGGRYIVQEPVRNVYSKYYISYEEYPADAYPPLCNNMGYILSNDVFRDLYQATFENHIIPLDNIFVGVLLNGMNIIPRNMSDLVYGKAFQLNSDPINVVCNYVIIHLHGNYENDANKVWFAMRNRCNKP